MLGPGIRSLAILAVLIVDPGTASVDSRNKTDKVLSYHAQGAADGDRYQLVSTSEPGKNKAPAGPAEEKVSSSDLPLADKQYDYPLVRPVYAPFVTRPSVPSWPYVEILDHHRNPPFVTSKPNQHYVGNPMVSSVVVQDMSQTASPKPPLILDQNDAMSAVDDFHHLGPTKIPFTDVQVITKPIRGKPSPVNKIDPNFTDKLEETSLEDSGFVDSEEEQESNLLENPPHLDVGGIVEDVLKNVFQEKPVLYDAGKLIPEPSIGVKTWPCPPVTCCLRSSSKTQPKCSTFVNCIAGRAPECPLRAESLPQALALTKPANGLTNATDPKADVRDGEPRFKKKKILKKKKKFLKKFLLPLLLAYKLLFLLIVPLLVNGMMMMMSSSGMAGFFFALIGASVTMVRVYSGTRHAPTPPTNKVVKVIKYIQPAPPSAPPPPPTTQPPPPTIIHQEHYPTYHAPPHPPPPPPAYGSYYPPPYWTRNSDRSEVFDGGRKKRRRKDDAIDDPDLTGSYLVNASENEFWIV